jgi:deoxyinosine 3'endonuclease (endonuclease V)
LGGYLFKALKGEVPVVGVAKNNFVDLMHQKRSVHRGNSQKPLFVTAMGIDIDKAAVFIHSMHGEFRMPTILKEVDRRSREVD